MKKPIFILFMVLCIGVNAQIEMILDTMVHTQKGYYTAYFSARGDEGDLVWRLHQVPSLSAMRIMYGDDVYPQVSDKYLQSDMYPLYIQNPILPDFPAIDTTNNRLNIRGGINQDFLIIVDDTSFFMEDSVINVGWRWKNFWLINTITGQRSHISRPSPPDTIYIHDTIYLEGIEDISLQNSKIYQRNGQIVVEGAEGNPVYLYDVFGRLLATKRETAQEVLLDVPASGAYLVKIGDTPAQKIVVR